MGEKPHNGGIDNWHWHRIDAGPNKGGNLIVGRFIDHPKFAGRRGHTSMVVKYDQHTGEIETHNSRYTLVGEETK